jgi:hypothetical protein
MEKGIRVIARDYQNQELLRVVWEDVGPGVLLCTVEAYDQAQREGAEPVTVGFPRHDIRPECDTR